MSLFPITIQKLLRKESLSFEEAKTVMQEIMSGQLSSIRIASWITALRMKGETPEEVGGCAAAMNASGIKIHCLDENVIDTCGTGGDGAGTFNISTAAAFVAAGAGATVAKHGNRAVSSKSGSADILSELDFNINMPVEDMEYCLNRLGIAFLFAPNLHPAMKHAMPVRIDLGIRTVFNIMGPLCNPANAKRAVIGVYDRKLCRIMAEAAQTLGKEHVMVVHGNDGLDEITTTTTTHICELRNNGIHEYDFDPIKTLGIPKSKPADLLGKEPRENAKVFREIISGEKTGPLRDIIVLNSAAAILVSGKAIKWEDALSMAEESLSSGRAYQKLKSIVEFCRKK
ncbi:MAG TPA: anthranilate phosphoribosyltransferase [Lentisphaeria bacterium]|nr:MAG: anthranilate phosphoribosyltransferase [Lentisphaerae bacterium GWF2_49_21]HBC85695.1 anthranilate phosphoribosyltransferase [Lentisphaeria bacterium]